jgi:hypothetical protein
MPLNSCNHWSYVQIRASKGLTGLNAKAPTSAEAFLYLFFNSTELSETKFQFWRVYFFGVQVVDPAWFVGFWRGGWGGCWA